MISLFDYINKHIIKETLKVNSKSKVESTDKYTFDLTGYKETVDLPFLLKIIGEEEEIKICKIDDVLDGGKHHIRLFDEYDKVAVVMREKNAVHLFKDHGTVMDIINYYNGNLYSRVETFKIDPRYI